MKTTKENHKEKLDIFSELVKGLALNSYTGEGSIGVMGAMYIPAEPSKMSSIKERQLGKSGLAIADLTSFFISPESQRDLPKRLHEIFEDIRPTGFAMISEAIMAEVPKENAYNADGSIKRASEFSNKIDVVNISLESFDLFKIITYEITKSGSLKHRRETEWEDKKSSTSAGGNLFNLLKKDYSTLGEDITEKLKTSLN